MSPSRTMKSLALGVAAPGLAAGIELPHKYDLD